MSLGITIQPVDADTAQSLPALAYLLLPEVWADEIDLGEYRGQPEPPVLEAVAHLLTSLNGYLHECVSFVADDTASAMLTGLSTQSRSLASSLHELADWVEQHPCPEQTLLDQLVAADEREQHED
jgi:hypothetical protein